ncbi:hypothetical protein [Streptomyces sp. C]|uniref:hypothetical protein n=1 Tax=Streptomyces sp. C TaxID=253839 RepID=UPI0001B4F27C|nr:hypothetical protein [Streptomyces sp. C]EFL19888.1 predicted protein [Streptomyces sp. C]
MAYLYEGRLRPQALCGAGPPLDRERGLSRASMTTWTDPLREPLTATWRARCGDDFHAVRVTAAAGAAAHARLGAQGPVLASAYCGIWYWLLPVNEVAPGSWSVPGTRIMPASAVISIPPATARTGPDIHWIVPPGPGSTRAAALAKALTGRTAPAVTQTTRSSARAV